MSINFISGKNKNVKRMSAEVQFKFPARYIRHFIVVCANPAAK